MYILTTDLIVLTVSDKLHIRLLVTDGAPQWQNSNKHLPIAVAARSKARTVFARSNTGIVGSNPT
jgi:hypothetical protein